MRIGIFGGAFDPVHIRHTEICRKIIGELCLSRLIVVPSFNPPHKDMPENNFFERVEMLKAALSGCGKKDGNGSESDRPSFESAEQCEKSVSARETAICENAEQCEKSVSVRETAISGNVKECEKSVSVRETVICENTEQCEKSVGVRETAPFENAEQCEKSIDGRGKDEINKYSGGEKDGSENCVIEISLMEYNEKKRNYAFETVREIAEKYPRAELFYIVGGDSLREFSTWKNPEKITAAASVAVVKRPGSDVGEAAEFLKKRLGARIFISDIEEADVSSAYIRTLIALGLDASEYLPKGVPEIISRAGLYRGFEDAVRLVGGLCSEGLFDHIKRTVLCAVKENERFGLDCPEVFLSALFHDAAKEIKFTELKNETRAAEDFYGKNIKTAVLKIDGEWLEKRRGKIDAKYYEKLKNSEYRAPADVPAAVLHQYTGAEIAEKVFGITNENILGAVRFHTTAKPRMSPLEKLIYTADKIESGRDYEGVGGIRAAVKNGLDEGFLECFKTNYKHISEKRGDVGGLTKDAAEYYL
ncbi:MAG: hypothetical protein LBP62_04450 [Clostridiales bacterium]|jgi:nicotinate-nucleotide adenylyltransferase|nr:hypothetical protein [Clostridiales bacterium]